MTEFLSDTNPKAEAFQIDLIRKMPSWKKIAIVDSLSSTIKSLAIAGIKQQNPEATPTQIHRRLAAQILGDDLAAKVYGSVG